jgi:hypothetical protein
VLRAVDQVQQEGESANENNNNQGVISVVAMGHFFSQGRQCDEMNRRTREWHASIGQRNKIDNFSYLPIFNPQKYH